MKIVILNIFVAILICEISAESIAQPLILPAQDIKCACDAQQHPNKQSCPTKRTFASDSICLGCGGETCTGISGQPCSTGVKCDKDFGLSCDSISGICKGKLQITVVNVTSNSATIRWKSRKRQIPHPGVFYSSRYEGTNTRWNSAHVEADEASVLLKNLKSHNEYVVRIMQDSVQEMGIFQTLEDRRQGLPQIRSTHRTASSISVAWDDFGNTNKYIIQYRPEEERYDSWMSEETDSNIRILNIDYLRPGTGYQIRVSDQDSRIVSDSILAFTQDGCVRYNRTYRVGEHFNEGCDLKCVCRGSDQGDCNPRCSGPFVKTGVVVASQTTCHQVPSKEDSCCVTIHCEHGKPGRCPPADTIKNGTECGRECSVDMDCLGDSKCCHSDVCGKSTCVSPLGEDVGDACSKLSCGPNSFCLISGDTARCNCLRGYTGNANDQRLGCDKFDPSLAPNDPGVCTYKSRRHPVGEEFFDGCDYRCHCTDSFEVECHQRCSAVPRTTSSDSCKLITDPLDSCCKVLACEKKSSVKTLNAAVKDQVTHPPRSEGCEYNGRKFSFEEQFNDGCESRCECEGKGRVSCTPRCSSQVGDPDSSCKLISHPNDTCCHILTCAQDGGAPPEGSIGLQIVLEQAKVLNSTQVALGFIWRFGEQPSNVQVWFGVQEDKVDWQKRKYKLVPSNGYILDVKGLEADTAYLMKIVVGKQESNTVRVKTFREAVGASFSGCFHGNRTYELGDKFNMGCELQCVCEHEGMIECQNRCELFVDTVGYEHCDWVESPDDSCCRIPMCEKRHRETPVLQFKDFNTTCSDEAGKTYKPGESFFKDCVEQCICQVNGKAICRLIDCHSPEKSSCVQPEIDPDFVPKAPNCCPPVKCKNDGSCFYKGQKLRNFQQVPQELVAECGQRCLCVNGAIQCEHRCPPVNSSPPPTLPCPPAMAYRGHLPGDQCCTHWMCKEDPDEQLSDISISAVNSTSARVRFTLARMFVGLAGHAEVHYTNNRSLDRDEWLVEKFSRPKRVFDSANIQYSMENLEADTTYMFQIVLVIDSMHAHPQSKIITVTMPPEPPTTPPLVLIDLNIELSSKDSNAIKVQWRSLASSEKQLVDGLKVKYRRSDSPKGLWKTSEMLHRDITAYEIEKIQPNTRYMVDIEPVSSGASKVVSSTPAEILTPNDIFSFKITLSPERISSRSASIVLLGVPSPLSRYINVVRLSRGSSTQPEREQSFQVLHEPKFYLDGLQPSTTYKVWIDAFLSNGRVTSSNILEVKTPSGAGATGGHNGLHRDTRKTLQTALLVIVVLGLLILIGFGLIWSSMMIKKQKSGPSDHAAYDNPTYKVEMTTMVSNNNNNNGDSQRYNVI